MTSAEVVSIPADDGRLLVGRYFFPDHQPRGAVLVAPAMATPAAFYGPFATALADAGFLVLTFDYRGMEPGGDVRGTRADVRTWAADAAAALDALRETLDVRGWNTPITWVGHSLGGQILGFVDHSVVDRVVVVATGHGYWKHNPPALRRWVRIFWDLVVPVSVAIAGYYPGRRLRFLGDLPAGVAWQWRRWCLHPGYWEADVPDIRSRHEEVTAPITAIHLADDEIVAERGIRSLLRQLTSARTELVVLAPGDLGSSTVGHHGFFRPAHAPAWSRLLIPRLATARPAVEHDVA